MVAEATAAVADAGKPTPRRPVRLSSSSSSEVSLVVPPAPAFLSSVLFASTHLRDISPLVVQDVELAIPRHAPCRNYFRSEEDEERFSVLALSARPAALLVREFSSTLSTRAGLKRALLSDLVLFAPFLLDHLAIPRRNRLILLV